VICSGLIALAIGFYSIGIVRDGLSTGRTYTVGIVFDDKRMVDRIGSPTAYWMMMGLFGFSCGAGLVLGILTPILVIKAYVEKLVRQRKARGPATH